MDFHDVVLADSDALSHAFLNGTSFRNVAFVNAALDQCEFGESHFQQTVFVKSNLEGADFVRADVTGGLFENCDLTDGEWRESIFKRVTFDGCKFSHTTVNLCTFYECTFSNGSVPGLDYKAVNYNVFTDCAFDQGIASDSVLSRNFGMRPAGQSSALVPSESGLTLEQVCRVSGLGPVKVFDLVRAIENECANFQGRMRKIRFEFISNIVSALAWQKRISPAALLYVERLLASLASTIGDESELRAIMSALIMVRNSLLDRLNQSIDSVRTEPEDPCAGLRIEYISTFSRTDAHAFAQSLDDILTGGRGKVQLSSYQVGSTIMDIDVTAAVCTVASVLMAVNFLLSQAKITVTKIRAIAKEMVRPDAKASRKPRRPKIKNKVPALLFSGRSIPELSRLRRAVQERGRTLVRMDEPAKVEVVLTPREGRRKGTKD